MPNKVKKSSLYLPADLHREFKVMCARLDIEMTKALAIAVRQWLNRVNGNQQKGEQNENKEKGLE